MKSIWTNFQKNEKSLNPQAEEFCPVIKKMLKKILPVSLKTL